MVHIASTRQHTGERERDGGGHLSTADWTEGGAEFNEARTHRHSLWRARPMLGVLRPLRLGACMHNPSDAGELASDNDQTVRKLMGFGERWGFHRVDVANLGDRIATKPKDFYAALDKVSAVCDARIAEIADRADVMLVAWGSLSKPWARERAREVLRLIGRPVVCIALTGDGDPWHPLMAKYTAAPLPFAAPPQKPGGPA